MRKLRGAVEIEGVPANVELYGAWGGCYGGNLVTKDDLENAVEKLELRITIKVYGAVVVGVALIKALDFLLG